MLKGLRKFKGKVTLENDIQKVKKIEKKKNSSFKGKGPSFLKIETRKREGCPR